MKDVPVQRRHSRAFVYVWICGGDILYAARVFPRWFELRNRAKKVKGGLGQMKKYVAKNDFHCTGERN